MKTYKTIEQEINQIRLKIYEETKDLTPEQYTDRVRRIGENAAKKYGFQRITNPAGVQAAASTTR
ncbi:MAG: hypothetical protein FWF73_07995 [Spirochaetes bacterium]|nr:hypothetical protein [Spirochaetota bacterium]